MLVVLLFHSEILNVTRQSMHVFLLHLDQVFLIVKRNLVPRQLSRQLSNLYVDFI